MKLTHFLASTVLALGLGTTTGSAAEWDGAYVGLLTGTYDINGGGNATFNAARLGYNLQSGNLVYGGEFVYGTFPDFSINYWWVNGRVGYAIGDTFMVYGLVGRGGSDVPTQSWQYGLGAEAMITQSVSVRFEATQVQRDGVGFVGNTFSLGLGWNF